MVIPLAVAFCSITELPTDSCAHCNVGGDRATIVRNRALKLMAAHGLMAAGWHFGYDKAKGRLGACSHSKRIIWLSMPWMMEVSDEIATNTILHEIAHALAPRDAGHNEEWRRIAVSIGCNGEVKCSDTQGAKISTLWKGTCPTCGHVAGLHRAPLRVKSCGKCSPRVFSPKHLLEWTRDGRTVTMPERYRSELNSIQRRYASV